MNLTLIKTAAVTGSRELLSPYVGLYLLFSLLINLAFGYPLSLLYTFAFSALLLLLHHRAPRTLRVLLAVTTLIAASYYPFGQTYGPPNFNTLLALHSTNVEEASEIMQIFPPLDYAIACVILLIGFIALRRKPAVKRSWSHVDSACLAFAAVAWLTQPVMNKLAGYPFSLSDAGYPVARFVKDGVVSNMSVKDEVDRMNQLSSLQDSWTVTGVKPSRQVYVIVIGESARRDALGAFGGRWNNTPFASQAKGQFFVNYTSAASSTQKSLGLTLNRVVDGKPLYQDNIITLAKRAGFDTWWFSNQGQIGKYDTSIASIARRADHVHFLKQGDFEADKSTHDEDLLKLTPEALKQPVDAPRLLIYHIIGSHPKACDRTQGKFASFVHSTETSCYLYSITQTDHFLHQLQQQLHSSGLSYSMLYFSDHGMAFKEKGSKNEYLAHDDKFQQNFQVPMFITSSQDTKHQLIKAARSANDFLQLFSQWTGISSKQIIARYRFVSKDAAPPVYVTDFALKKVNYPHLGQDTFAR
ncbi:phosphoethanolamine transferase [Winslowiella iniecta]|uniref:Phosphoethanolamine transferase n=1 Tax=Winslowiella iniecta TaxID=1560201 RepID=A0A0L7TBS0_9GAMM|nr:sulfatase-like hydrolase/transferase [Winslowiella iniecta]KOC92824.1 phosphoethanolamine transferase [Winslowiella iniecta]KOC95257.1 phosphoethanolamine transferase [Winslowiella iniecta]